MAQNETSGAGIGDLRSIFGRVPWGGDDCLIIRQEGRSFLFLKALLFLNTVKIGI